MKMVDNFWTLLLWLTINCLCLDVVNSAHMSKRSFIQVIYVYFSLLVFILDILHNPYLKMTSTRGRFMISSTWGVFTLKSIIAISNCYFVTAIIE